MKTKLKDKSIKEIMDILHEVNSKRGDKYFEGVMDKLLDSDEEKVVNYLKILRKLL